MLPVAGQLQFHGTKITISKSIDRSKLWTPKVHFPEKTFNNVRAWRLFNIVRVLISDTSWILPLKINTSDLFLKYPFDHKTNYSASFSSNSYLIQISKRNPTSRRPLPWPSSTPFHLIGTSESPNTTARLTSHIKSAINATTKFPDNKNKKRSRQVRVLPGGNNGTNSSSGIKVLRKLILIKVLSGSFVCSPVALGMR